MATPVWASNWRRSGAATAMRLAPRMPKLTAPCLSVPTFVLIAEMWRTKLEEAYAGCFAPQISGWNDSDGEPLAGARCRGFRRAQTRTRRGDSDSVNLGRIQVPQPSVPVFSGVSPLAR